MKNLTAKQQARLEKKTKKLAALTEIIKLNDNDRIKRNPSFTPSPSSTPTVGNDVKAASVASRVAESDRDEPSRKRLKRSSSDLVVSGVDIDNTASIDQSSLHTTKVPTPTSAEANAYGTLDYAAMKRSLNARKRTERSVPKIRLKLYGEAATLRNAPADRTPVFLTDVQHLLMATVLGSDSPCQPYRWCHIERGAKVSHVVVLVVEGCSLDDYIAAEHSDAFAFGRQLSHQLEVVMPADGHIVEELVQVALTDSQSDQLIERYGSLEAAIESTRNQALSVQTVFPVQPSAPPAPLPKDGADAEMVSRTQLLLSAVQLVDEGYPIPLTGELANRYRDYVMTKDAYAAVTAASPMFGLDCEMCRTTVGINELTRISIVNERYESVYETLVRPENRIVDYLTKYSGITGAMMLNVTKTRAQVQQEVRALLPPDAILVGQSLNSDLVAMQMMHPYVIDTSCIFNLSGDRRTKSKLQALALEFLGERIQDNPLGHDSIEDCSASLRLTKLKLAHGVDFGDAILRGRRRANEAAANAAAAASNGVAVAGGPAAADDNSTNAPLPAKRRRCKSTLVISSAETNVDYGDFVATWQSGTMVSASDTAANIRCEQSANNAMAVQRTAEMAIQHDLTIGHVRVPSAADCAGGGGDAAVTKRAARMALIDRWIGQCWDSVGLNGLFVVLMGGGGAGSVANAGETINDDSNSSSCSRFMPNSGVLLMDVKSNADARVKYRK